VVTHPARRVDRPYLDVLIVENNPSDARLTIEAFREVGLREGIRCYPDGDEALAVLNGTGPLPHLIFLDLDLPKTPGLKVLDEIKTNDRLKVIPVVVVSDCNDPHEVRRAYELHASCFIYKPLHLHQFLHFVRSCYEFWGGVVTLPPGLG